MKLLRDLLLLIFSVCAFMVLLGLGLKFYWTMFMLGWGLI